MEALAHNFFTHDEQEQIKAAVAQAESQSSVEIVAMVVSSSHPYPAAKLRAACVLALPLALLSTLFVMPFLWWRGELLWPFLLSFAVFFILFFFLAPQFANLYRFFLSATETNFEVGKEAMLSFHAEQLHQTRDATGVLVFISVLERRVWILGDEGIDAVFPVDTWQNLVDALTAGIREQRQCEALCAVIRQIGDLVQSRFPRKSDDQNELPDLIIRKQSTSSSPPLVIR